MRDPSIVVTPEPDPGAPTPRNHATARGGPKSLAEIVAIDPRARAAWGALRDIAYASPGTVIVGLDGTTLRIRDDGGADEVSAVPHRWSVSADPAPRGSTG